MPSGKRPSSVQKVVSQCSRAVVIVKGAASVVFLIGDVIGGVILIERQGKTNDKSGSSIVLFVKIILK